MTDHEAQQSHERSEILQWCRDINGNRLDVGDTVESCGTGDDNEGGEVLELRSDGCALVGWESGVRTWHPCADLVLV